MIEKQKRGQQTKIPSIKLNIFHFIKGERQEIKCEDRQRKAESKKKKKSDNKFSYDLTLTL